MKPVRANRDGPEHTSAATPAALVTQAAQKFQLPSCVPVGTSLVGCLEHVEEYPSTQLAYADSAAEVSCQHHSPGQPEEVIEVQASLLDRPRAGIVAAAQLRPQSVHQPSSVASATLSGFVHPKAPAPHRARLDLETNFNGSYRATLEGSRQLSKRTVGSVTVGTDVCKGGVARGVALEARLTRGSKLLLRCLVENYFGWQWLATWSQQLTRHHRLELQGTWHRRGCGHAAGSPSFLADRCGLSLHLVGTDQVAAPADALADSDSTGRAHHDRHPTTSGLQASGRADGDSWHAALDKQPQWSVMLSCDPRAVSLWGLHAQLH